MCKEITLTGGQIAIVDDDDFARVSQHSWYLGGHGVHLYAMRWVPVSERVANNLPSAEKMHRFILGLTRSHKEIVDHIDHDGLNNTRANLRVTTYSGNNQHRRAIRGKLCQFKGVTPRKQFWFASIKIRNKAIRLGNFDTAETAARAYDHAARIYFGEFAVLNFPNEMIEVYPKPRLRGEAPPRSGTGYKGVHPILSAKPGGNMFQAKFGRKGYIGCFPTAEEAARAYDKAAREILGPGCFVNFPDESIA